MTLGDRPAGRRDAADADRPRPDVRRWLGDPADGGRRRRPSVTMRYVVTHRAALRARLYELGRRVDAGRSGGRTRELVDELAS